MKPPQQTDNCRREASPLRFLVSERGRRPSLGAEHTSGSVIPNAQRLNTVYDFTLPGIQNLTEAVAANTAELDEKNFCVKILETTLLTGGAKRYNEKEVRQTPLPEFLPIYSNPVQNSSGYTHVFEEPCMRILERLAQEITPGPDGCRFSDIDLTNIKQREYVFAKTRSSSLHEYGLSFGSNAIPEGPTVSLWVGARLVRFQRLTIRCGAHCYDRSSRGPCVLDRLNCWQH